MKDYVVQDKAERLEEIKEKALRMVIQFAEGCEMDKENAERLRDGYANLNAKYPRYSEVWFLDDIIPLHCKVICITTNKNGHAFYKISEVTGRTVRAGEWINEDLLFPSREALVERLKETLNIPAKKLKESAEFNERFCEVLRQFGDDWVKAGKSEGFRKTALDQYGDAILRLALQYIEL